MIVEDFRQGGIKHWDRDWLNMLVNTPASWSAQSLSTLPVTPSGPAAFLGFTARRTRLTSCACTVRVWLQGSSGSGVVTSGVSTSKRVKKQFSPSASENATPGSLAFVSSHFAA